jgi:NADH:ubiquinone oxidoreductase subunit B-like Fe-S oxidoreductase
LSWKHHRCQFPDLNSCQDPCKDLRKTNTAVNQNSKHQEGAEDIFKWKKSASIWNYTQGISKTF